MFSGSNKTLFFNITGQQPMPHPIYSIPVNDEAALLLTPCPGTKESDLVTALQEIISQNCTALLTLMESHELEEHHVSDIGQQTTTIGMQWFHLPINDETLPDAAFEDKWESIAPRLHQLLDSGNSIAMHCRGGTGRTGLVAARLLVERGMDTEEAMALVRAQRPDALSWPDRQAYIRNIKPRG
jgi:protein-tyrosine phosphatase